MKIKNFLFVIALAIPLSIRASGIPTVDIVGNIQQALDYLESLSQTVAQGKQLVNEISMIKNQLDQAAREIQNLEKLGNYDWVDMNNSLKKLEQAALRTNALVYASGDLEGGYDTYKDQAYYKSNQSSYKRAEAVERWNNNATATTKSSAAVIDQQATLLESDGQQLSRLQQDVSAGTGAQAAMETNSQLQAFTAQQLMYVRQLQMNGQQVMLQKRAEEAEQAAIDAAQTNRLNSGTVSPRAIGESGY